MKTKNKLIHVIDACGGNKVDIPAVPVHGNEGITYSEMMRRYKESKKVVAEGHVPRIPKKREPKGVKRMSMKDFILNLLQSGSKKTSDITDEVMKNKLTTHTDPVKARRMMRTLLYRMKKDGLVDVNKGMCSLTTKQEKSNG